MRLHLFVSLADLSLNLFCIPQIATIMSGNQRKDDTRRWQQEIEGYEKSLVELRRMEGVEASIKAANEDLPKMGENFNRRKAACDQVVKQAKDVSGGHIIHRSAGPS